MNILTLIAGDTSVGKTTSLRNLTGNSVILNTERKALPFKSKGVHNVMVTTATDDKGREISASENLLNLIKTIGVKPNIENIIIDSFSAFIETVLLESKAKFKGFDVWNNYNTQIGRLFQVCKDIDKKIFIIAHVEKMLDAEGNAIMRVKSKGNEWSGFVEKEFTCAFFGKTKVKESGNGVTYHFITNTDGSLNAKTPWGMFDDFYIDNDVQKIIDVYDEFYDLKPKKVLVTK